MTAIEDANAALARFNDPEADAWGYQECNRQRHQLADAIRALIAEHEATVREMHARELHHFETEKAMSEALAELERIRVPVTAIAAISRVENILKAALHPGVDVS